MYATQQQRFEEALDSLVERVKEDDHILAAILCGSLSYDVVWDKSDIDLVLVCTDDKKTKTHLVSLVEHDINIHVTVQPRLEFRRSLESSVRNSFEHSMYARGRLVYSKDPSIDELFYELSKLGEHDTQLQLMSATQHALFVLYKARKWFEIKDDLYYTARWIVQTALPLAEVEVGLAGEIVDREALTRALELNPVVFQKIYSDLFEQPITREKLEQGINAIDDYLVEKADLLFGPVLEYLRSAFGEPRSATQIEHYFTRNFGINGITMACEWLADIGRIEKASTPVKLTTRSQVQVDEVAFLYLS
ncbi:MAG: hypothetical protein OXG24_12370 [Gammaproteobacteria bacterium]|nr:hypothetical protein [Gammaproteobacteria bacterium]